MKRSISGLKAWSGLAALLVFLSAALLFRPTTVSNPAPTATVAAYPTDETPPSPTFIATSHPKNTEPPSFFYRRETNFGTIIESGYSIYPSTYYIQNQWFAAYPDKTMMLFAGAQIGDPLQGGKALEKPWPSLVILDIRDSKGNAIQGTGKYYLPTNQGPLRILSADQSKVHVISGDNQLYAFDLNRVTFTHINEQQDVVKNVSSGTLVESSLVPFMSSDYDFQNYWYTDRDGYRLSIYAGSLRQDRFTSVVVKIISGKDGNKIDGLVYKLPTPAGPAHIIDVIDNQVILVTVSGLALAFDMSTGQFTTLVDGKVNAHLSEVLIATPEDYSPPAPPVETGSLATPTITPLPSFTPSP